MTTRTDPSRHENALGDGYADDMTSRFGPLALITFLFLLIAFVVSAIWLVSLPSRTLSELQSQARLAGFELKAGSSEFTFDGGAGARFRDVDVTSADGGTTGKIASLSLAGVFPWTLPQLALERPNFTLRIPSAASGLGKAGLVGEPLPRIAGIVVEDGQLRIVERREKAIVSIESLTGAVQPSASGLMFKGNAGINGVRTTFRMETEDARKLLEDGAPTDIFITSPSDASPFDIQFSGRLRLAKSFALDGRFSAATGDAQVFAAVLGLPNVTPISGPLAAEGGVSIANRGIDVNDLTLTQGDTEAKGRVKIGFGSDTHSIDGVLHVPRLVLPPLDMASPWSTRDFALADFSSLRGVFEVQAQTLVFGPLAADTPKLTARLDDTGAALTLNAGKDREQLEATLKLSQQAPVPQFAISGQLSTQNAQTLAQALSGSAFFAGPLDGTFDLASSGRNMAEAVAGLAGTIKMTLKDSTFQGEAAQRVFTGGVVAAEIATDVRDGLAVFDVTSARVGGKAYALKGEIDLLRKALALDVTPKGGKRIGVLGPWAAPEIGAEIIGAPSPVTADDQSAASSN